MAQICHAALQMKTPAKKTEGSENRPLLLVENTPG
jgi:hypothetical protein